MLILRYFTCEINIIGRINIIISGELGWETIFISWIILILVLRGKYILHYDTANIGDIFSYQEKRIDYKH